MMMNNQLGYQNVDPFMADEVNYTHRIINDEVRADLVPDMAALVIFFLIGLLIATLRFKKRLD